MNCLQCQSDLVKFLEKSLSEEESNELLGHLNHCSTCAELYSRLLITERVIELEKASMPNPFLSTRVMTELGKFTMPEKGPSKVIYLRPVVMAASVMLAISLGILAGSLYKPVTKSSQLPEELVYLNDSNIEAITVFENN